MEFAASSDSEPTMCRPSLVLDLDETLVHTTAIKPPSDSFTSIRVGRRRVYLKFRPGVRDFILAVAKYFDIFFFTSANSEYANQIIDKIAPEVPREQRLFRDKCQSYCGYPVKNLEILNRPLNKIILIDDIEGSALLQPSNLIRIAPFQGDDEDRVLLDELLPMLLKFALEPDLPSALYRMMTCLAFEHLKLLRLE